MWTQKQQQTRHQQPVHRELSSGCHLNFYSQPPEEHVSIEDFESFAIDRLQVLKSLENDKVKGLKPAQQQDRAKQLVSKHLSGGAPSETGKKDLISHFVLRLAYCRTEELRRWFVAQESDLFRFRFNLEPPSNQAAFLKKHNLPFESVQGAELEDVQPDLVQLLNAMNMREQAADFARSPSADTFFKVPWEQVPDLVAHRKVVLRRGEAFVHKREMGSLVVSHFRKHLSRALALTARKWATHLAAEEEGRLTPVVESLSTRYLGPDFSHSDDQPKEAVTCRQLPALAKQNFPLCMQTMFNGLHETRHLKHDGRQQMGLFLKGIGLPLEEALAFWRSEFAPLTPPDKFDKQYAYNIRYNYGKEGKRTDYTPYSCLKVISSIPAPTDHHGCPYKTFSADRLTAALSQLRIDPQRVRQTVAKAKAGHYQLACGMAFEGIHHCHCDTGINHPNQYYVESRKAIVAKEENGSGPADATKAERGRGME